MYMIVWIYLHVCIRDSSSTSRKPCFLWFSLVEVFLCFFSISRTGQATVSEPLHRICANSRMSVFTPLTKVQNVQSCWSGGMQNSNFELPGENAPFGSWHKCDEGARWSSGINAANG